MPTTCTASVSGDEAKRSLWMPRWSFRRVISVALIDESDGDRRGQPTQPLL